MEELFLKFEIIVYHLEITIWTTLDIFIHLAHIAINISSNLSTVLRPVISSNNNTEAQRTISKRKYDAFESLINLC